MTRKTPLALFAPMALALALLSGCAMTGGGGGVDVTRSHLGVPIPANGIHVETLTGYAGVGPEDPVYIGAVSAELQRLGFTPGDGETPYIAAVSYKHGDGSDELDVQIKRRSDNSIVWQGRAVTAARTGTAPGATATRLANALFKGFPGQSGVTITVK